MRIMVMLVALSLVGCGSEIVIDDPEDDGPAPIVEPMEPVSVVLPPPIGCWIDDPSGARIPRADGSPCLTECTYGVDHHRLEGVCTSGHGVDSPVPGWHACEH